MALIFSDDEDENTSTSPQVTRPASKPFRPQDTLVENVPQWESALRGAISGLSGGLAPKAGSAVASVISGQPYPKLLHDYLERDRQAAIANPVTSTVANIAGSVPVTLATGAGIIPSAIVGATNSWGNTEKTGLGGAVEAGKGAAVSGTISAMFPILGKIFGGVNNAFRGGSVNPEKLADAAIKFKNAPAPVGKSSSTWTEMQDINKVPLRESGVKPTFDARRGRVEPTKTLDDDTVKQLIQGAPYVDSMGISAPMWKEIVSANNKTVPGITQSIKESAVPAAISAAGSAAAGGWASDFDPEVMMKSGLGGAVAGATGARFMSKAPSRLRAPTELMPDLDAISGRLGSGLYDVAEGVTNVVRSAGTQLGARNVETAMDAPTSPFGVITDWLDHSKGTTNPAVEQKAQEAQAASESGDPEEKRKAANELSATPDGRAVTNSDSDRRSLVFE